jgi:uncharacterized membrane protein YbhN (UPF0104 family)
MNTGRLIAGIICLVIGLFLIVLGFALDPEKVWFTVGNINIPGVLLGLLGLVLLFTAGWGRRVSK